MIVVADINTLWRKKPFAALAKLTPVLGLAPRRWGQKGSLPEPEAAEGLLECHLSLPPGWASKWQRLTGMRLRAAAGRIVHANGKSISAWVVTSPHYLRLVLNLRGKTPIFYYCSDDYSQYVGWGGSDLLAQERRLVQSVNHSFFVSQALADRACKSYGVARANVSVSMNATEPAFFNPVPVAAIDDLLSRFPQIRRPIVGVVGGINDRLDFELIARCAQLTCVGSVVLVGDVSGAVDSLERLRGDPKCVFVGHRPHGELPVWLQALDAALIPYRDTLLNRSCSPMRLFDHMAAGRPIVATAVNDQINHFAPPVHIGRDAYEVCYQLERILKSGVAGGVVEAQRRLSQDEVWSKRAAGLHQTIQMASTRRASLNTKF